MTARPAAEVTPSGKPRARALGIPFAGTPGPLNAITDLPGLAVGYETLIRGEGELRIGQGPVRTGVTAILPRGHDGVGTPCAAGMVSLNGNGEMTGTAWIEETGSLDLPILITNTHSIGACHSGAIEWIVRNKPKLAEAWLLPIVAETWDGYLNDINGAHVKPEHAIRAIDVAGSGPIEEGSVGGGTGMNCYAFKGGCGSASRIVDYAAQRYTVGAFVQANFGSRHELTIAGVPVGRTLSDDNPMETRRQAAPAGAGSVIAIVGTDAPLLPGQCKALARRVGLGLARTGTTGSHFSGDLFLAFSTGNAGALKSRFPNGEPTTDEFDNLRFVPWGRMDPFYAAVAHAIEEAVVNALIANATMIGRDGHRTPALPHDKVISLLREHRVIR